MIEESLQGFLQGHSDVTPVTAGVMAPLLAVLLLLLHRVSADTPQGKSVLHNTLFFCPQKPYLLSMSLSVPL